jgi:hypothetical protein
MWVLIRERQLLLILENSHTLKDRERELMVSFKCVIITNESMWTIIEHLSM